MSSSYRLLLFDAFPALGWAEHSIVHQIQTLPENSIHLFQFDVFLLTHLTFKQGLIGSVVCLLQQSCQIVYLLPDFLSSSIISSSLTFILSSFWVLA